MVGTARRRVHCMLVEGNDDGNAMRDGDHSEEHSDGTMTTPRRQLAINAETRLNRVLDLDPAVLEYIVALDPHDFERLHNPVMRRLMPPRITLGRVAVMAGVPLDLLLAHIAELGGATVDPRVVAPELPQSPHAKPAWTTQPPSAMVDLLPLDDALDGDPLPPVIAAIKALAPGESMCFRHRWEPQPFYDVWTKMGSLEWFADQTRPDEWWIWVRRVVS